MELKMADGFCLFDSANFSHAQICNWKLLALGGQSWAQRGLLDLLLMAVAQNYNRHLVSWKFGQSEITYSSEFYLFPRTTHHGLE
jgi:hypothetical protein